MGDQLARDRAPVLPPHVAPTPQTTAGRAAAVRSCRWRCRSARRSRARHPSAGRCGRSPTGASAPPQSRRSPSTGSRQVSQLPQGALQRLAEILQQHLPTAAHRLAVASSASSFCRSIRFCWSGAPPASISWTSRGRVLQAVDHPDLRRQPVAAGAAGFLVIGLQALRRVEMGDEAHVGLVDAHAEGDGRRHHHAVVLQEPALVLRPHLGGQPGVIGQARRTLCRAGRRPCSPPPPPPRSVGG